MIYSIGHSTHPIEVFIGLLKKHGVEVLADIRSVPMSRFNPQFRQRELKKAVEATGMEYVYLGGPLGGKPYLPFAQRTAMPEFKSGMEALKKIANEKRVAIMCAEKEPLNCHRTLLVSRALAEEKIPVMHIMGDGSLRAHQEVENDLLGWQKMESAGLFDTRETQVAEAYDKRRAAGSFKRK
jgi:uncharacterized protein (DUF488 family)